MVGRARRSAEDRFWAKVEKTAGCWNWTGGTVRGGYGWFWIEGEIREQAHRLSWKWAKGEIPAGIMVLHDCDNPACVRPSHLYLGDNDDNMRDRTKRKRHWANLRPKEHKAHMASIRFTDGLPGERNPMAKLTWDKVRQLRARASETRTSLAREFGLSLQCVCNVLNGKTWKEASR